MLYGFQLLSVTYNILLENLFSLHYDGFIGCGQLEPVSFECHLDTCNEREWRFRNEQLIVV